MDSSKIVSVFRTILLGLDLGHARELRAAGEFALGIDMEELLICDRYL